MRMGSAVLPTDPLSCHRFFSTLGGFVVSRQERRCGSELA